MEFKGGVAKGSVRPPGSKSYTHRALLMAALSGGVCRITDPLISRDIMATVNALRSMGSEISIGDGAVTVRTEVLHAPDRPIDVGNSGTTLRFITAVSSLFDSEVSITGDGSILRRPMGPLLDALSSSGAVCTSDNGNPPITVRGRLIGGRITVERSMSSQFVSSLMIVSPLIGRPVEIHMVGKETSDPYIDMTQWMMGEFGVNVEREGDAFKVLPQRYLPRDMAIPSDFSSAAYPLVAGALSGEVSVRGLDIQCPQGDAGIIGILESAGCSMKRSGDTVTCRNEGRPRSMDIDLSGVPDLFPTVAVLLSVADGRSRLYNVPQLRYKESDRISSTVGMLSSLGADIEGTEDGCIIEGVERLKGGKVDHRGDHRIMMAAAVASFVSEGAVSMEDDGCYSVSYPGFLDDMRSIGLRC